MTTPATPAADAVKRAFERAILAEDPDAMLSVRLGGPYIDGEIQTMWWAWQECQKAATARESALVAERDAYKAMVEDVSTEVHLLRAALVYIAEESDDMVALKCAQDALAAPAVEGE